MPALLGLLAIAFWAGDFVGQWRIHSALQNKLVALEARIIKLEERFMFHDGKDGHSKVIERLTTLEIEVEHLSQPWSFRPPLGDQ